MHQNSTFKGKPNFINQSNHNSEVAPNLFFNFLGCFVHSTFFFLIYKLNQHYLEKQCLLSKFLNVNLTQEHRGHFEDDRLKTLVMASRGSRVEPNKQMG
jgi:hypothetical protein